ncbi:MAG: DUF4242 domain-containing protein [Agriterribacter sp.]
MKRFIIERNLPGAGNLSPEELESIAKTSMSSVAVLGKPYHWVESYVTNNKIYCVHEAESEDVIREHSSCAGFPVSAVEEVKAIIGPSTAG